MITQTDFLKAAFFKSISNISQISNKSLPEVAFAGRSNVGKSSLLNALFQRKNLVKTSSTPGKTQLINYFDVNNKFFCVDLPGYGYAKISKDKKATWQNMIESFLTKNKQLKMIYLLVDSRHELMKSDEEMIAWMKYCNLNFTLILSKIDKISKNELAHKVTLVKSYSDKNTLSFSFKNMNLVNTLRNQIITDLKSMHM
ncbi:MAG: YihA family ribosome biogenesis GTP-binding protein [Calditrichae bacterium]|nr:YihA family ribosome biogenesis GTP-binding protein [Calditrichota bacterium]MCB9057220.1 YihA family ribosome biogenesis GTP-binding protein [Calditrichia bacterium]